jgi:hypothetical protein
VFAFESNESEDLGDSGDRICGTVGRTIIQASNWNTNIKLYSFHDRIIHVEGGIYRGPSLRNLYTNDHYTPLFNQYNPSKLQGRSCLFTLRDFILHVVLSIFKVTFSSDVFASLT